MTDVEVRKAFYEYVNDAHGAGAERLLDYVETLPAAVVIDDEYIEKRLVAELEWEREEGMAGDSDRGQ